MKKKISEISEEKEKIPLLAIYRHDKTLHLKINEDEASLLEIYGFLDIYMDKLREQLIENINYDEE